MSRVRGRDDRRTLKALSVAQIALAMLVLVVGGLLMRSFETLLGVNPGIDSRGVLTFQLELPMAATASYPTQPHRDVFFETLVQRVGAVPEVAGVTIASAPPLEEEPSESSLRLSDDPTGTFRQASFRMVSPSYFGLLEIPILRGRSFESTDTRHSPAVVIVSDALARNAWGDESPIGKRINLSAERQAEVVGVVGNVRIGGLDTEAGRTVYMATTQGAYNFMTMLVKTSNNPTSLAPTMRRVVRELDSAVPLHHVRTLDAIVATSIAHQRFQMLLVSAFSALMLALAVIGTYGVTAYGVSERTNELGIRAALGATAGDIRRLVVGEGLRLAGYGILIGAVTAVALSSVLSRFLFGIRALDWATFLIVPTLLAATMLAATLLPAYRASRVDPMRALRSE